MSCTCLRRIVDRRYIIDKLNYVQPRKVPYSFFSETKKYLIPLTGTNEGNERRVDVTQKRTLSLVPLFAFFLFNLFQQLVAPCVHLIKAMSLAHVLYLVYVELIRSLYLSFLTPLASQLQYLSLDLLLVIKLWNNNIGAVAVLPRTSRQQYYVYIKPGQFGDSCQRTSFIYPLNQFDTY